MTTTKTVAEKTAPTEEPVRFCGVHHRALNTDDMK
jgi:hypothetical protein